jgi:N-acetyl-alpha-D-glucosaminyl L-malate synthase BshA
VTLHRLRRTREPLSPRLQPHWPRRELESFVDLLLAAVDAADLDVLHFHYALPFADVAARLRHRLGAACPRLIMTLHGTDVTAFAPDPRSGRAVGRALAGLDELTTVSDSHARLSAQVFGLDRPPEVIPNFVDLRRFRPRPALPFALRSRLHRRPRIAHVSNFRSVKDPESVARVFAQVRGRVDAELWLVGDGDGMPSVRSILRAAGVERDVRYFGLRREIHGILRRSDVLLLTSRTESFCLAALEAAACGIPVVAPRVGGLPEVVVDGETGLLFEPGEEGEAVAAILRLLADGELRAAIAGAATGRARLFSSDEIVERYVRLYRQVLERDARVRLEPAPAGLLAGARA